MFPRRWETMTAPALRLSRSPLIGPESYHSSSVMSCRMKRRQAACESKKCSEEEEGGMNPAPPVSGRAYRHTPLHRMRHKKGDRQLFKVEK